MLEIVEYPDSILSTVCVDVLEGLDDLDRLKINIDKMIETMYASGGVGLAAPQVNLVNRIAIIDPSGGDEANQLVVMINPRVTWKSPEAELGEEGCLSLPGVTLQVLRSAAINVEYIDAMGRLQQDRCTGYKARIVQHEVDHLDGLMMLDRVGSLTRKLALQHLGKNR